MLLAPSAAPHSLFEGLEEEALPTKTYGGESWAGEGSAAEEKGRSFSITVSTAALHAASASSILVKTINTYYLGCAASASETTLPPLLSLLLLPRPARYPPVALTARRKE